MLRCIIVVSLLLAGCEGPTGPEGPMGPEGAGTYLTMEATVSSGGSASIHLPAQAGTSSTPPAMSCYLSENGTTWLVVGMDTYSSITCGLVADGNHLDARIINAPSGWRFRVAVVY